LRSLLSDAHLENPEGIDEMAEMYGGRYSVDRPEAPLDFLRAVMKYLLQFLKGRGPAKRLRHHPWLGD
jgi:ribosomal protein S19E (S16A)